MDDEILFFFEEDNFLNNFQGNLHLNYLIEELTQPVCEEILEKRQRNVVVRNEDYFKETIPRYTDDQFSEHFQMSRITFQNLINVIGNGTKIHQVLSVDLHKKVMYTLWLLATSEGFRAVGDRFCLPQSTGHQIFKEIVSTLAKMVPSYITWPNTASCTANAAVFQEYTHGFPGVVGAIGRCDIRIKQPPHAVHDFCNRKGYHSIILQGICDQQGKFINCFIGSPGQMDDAAVFCNSPIYQQITNNQNPLIPEDLHILGDFTYPLLLNVLTPFQDTGYLTSLQAKYNNKLRSCRSVIDNAFKLLKSKFRRLKYFEIQDMELGNQLITSSCVLYNFIVLHEGSNIEYQELEYFQSDEILAHAKEEKVEAIVKRNYILSLL